MTKIRWGVLGAASIADSVAPAIQASHKGTLTAVGSRSLDKATAFAQKHDVEHVFGSYQEVLDSNLVDAIYLPLPNTLHVPWLDMCLDAGLPVLCEKPLALSFPETDQIVRRFQGRNLLLAEGYMYRFHPQHARLKQLLGEGTIGQVTSLSAAFTFLEDDPKSIVVSPELGGGALNDIGGYCLDFFCQTLNAMPVHVRALANTGQVDLTTAGTLEFPGGVLANFEASVASSERHDARVNGTLGSIVLPNPWVAGKEDTHLRVQRYGEPDEVVTVPGKDPYQLEVEDFADALLGVSPLGYPPEHALNLARVMEEIRKAGNATP